ncbi:NAD(P)-binding protein [Zopfia rhizophila CBS 207.26]|uniref:NAD(P)-binding protein n=1 Tax=Zopfia rhizophila CBS 207.26 TaxID=1314779 RepID=A0A6A6EWU9_9PEZI|nr:NAD(P)-binding protein [Zopfia rhizophila CBS 207.26]
MSSIQKVAVLGASGSLGDYVVPALLEGGFIVTVISRPGSRGYTAGAKVVTTVEAAYDDISGLIAALCDHDALVEIFNPAATVHQRTIVRAALAAGIKHLITNEFGLDTFHPNITDLVSARFKVEAQRALEDELQTAITIGKPGTLSWTGIFSGVWYDWAIQEGKFWVNPATRTITRFGSGDQRTSISRAALNGEAVVAVLREPERFRNRPAYFASHTVTTNELIALVKEVSGDSEKSWNVADIPDMEAFKREAIRLWDEDTEKGVEDRLHSPAFVMLSTAAVFDEKNHFGADLGGKLEPGWDEGLEILKDQLRQLIKEAAN